MTELLAAATQQEPSQWDRIISSIDAGDVATVIAALIAVLGVVATAVLAAISR